MRLGTKVHSVRGDAPAGSCRGLCTFVSRRIQRLAAMNRSSRLNSNSYRRKAALLIGLMMVGGSTEAQQLVVGAGADYTLAGPGPMLVFPDLSANWNDLGVLYAHPTDIDSINPHAALYIDSEHVLATHAGRHRADIVDLVQDRLSFSIYPAGPGDSSSYLGFGSAAINPARTHVLLAPGSPSLAAQRTQVWVMAMPLSANAAASHVLSMPGTFGTAQSRAIAFDPVSGRAYIGHSHGITAVDPPYATANIAFTIALPVVSNAQFSIGRAIALSPDRQVLLSTATTDGRPLSIIHAPFGAGSVVEDLSIANAVRLDAVAFTPDGSQALVVDNAISNDLFSAQFFAVNAPYSASSTIARLPIARHTSANGFEDLAISADGQFAALVGGSFEPEDRLVLARAPFTAAGFRYQALRLHSAGLPYGSTGRGTGTAAFWPQALSVLPQITINRASVSEGQSGLRSATLTASLSHPASGFVSVDYATVAGSAAAGTDYIANQGTLHWQPGQREAHITVLVVGNGAVDGNRSFRVQLASPVNARLLQPAVSSHGQVEIVDDDGASILTDSPLPDACFGRPYQVQFTATGLTGALAWSIGSQSGFLNGLSLNAQSGWLSGIPGSVDQGEFTLVVRGDFPQIASRTYALRVRMECDRLFASGFE
jgi:hypothetical protein